MSDDSGRTVFRITGADARPFLQGLITNDVDKADDGLVYAALLSPQGKYLADFFVVADGDGFLLDVASGLAASLAQRLGMYKLRSDVAIETTELHVSRGLGDVPEGAWTDPRDPALGWRAYGDSNISDDTDWTALRVAHGVPESGVELIPNESYPLEMGFERLHGVDFKKGCYVGQEVTARMKHKTELRKGLARVEVEGAAPPGSEIQSSGKPVGTLQSQAGSQALAYLRFDRAGPGMTAGGATVHWRGQARSE